MVLVVASTLATASSLKSLQADNVRKEKMQNILSTIIQTDREQAETLYKQYITGTLALDHLGNIDETVDAFELRLNNEIKKPAKEQQRFPLPQGGGGQHELLYNSPAWFGAVGCHLGLYRPESQTSLLPFKVRFLIYQSWKPPDFGAEITQQWFMDRFEEEKVFDTSRYNLVGINVSETQQRPQGYRY